MPQPAHKFFGAMEVDACGSRVQMAEPEKTLLDCLDRPQYAGDIPVARHPNAGAPAVSEQISLLFVQGFNNTFAIIWR